jgi:hypothetical protein
MNRRSVDRGADRHGRLDDAFLDRGSGNVHDVLSHQNIVERALALDDSEVPKAECAARSSGNRAGITQ